MLAENFDRITWDCVHFLRGNELLPIEEIKKHGIEVFEIDGNRVKVGQDELLAEIAVAMKFPSYFGNNLDALNECLSDMSWLPAKGYVLVINNTKAFWSDVTLAGILIEIWLSSAENWSKENIPFHLVFAS